MKSTHIYLLTAFALFVILGLPALANAGKAEISLDNNDRNGDGKISIKEWKKKKKIFEGIDANEDGYLSLKELRARFGETADETPTATPLTTKMDAVVPISTIDDETLCGIGRSKTCSIKVAIKLGMFETGLRPKFPKGLNCRDIDEQWAISYTHKRNRENYHGGIDMPAPYGTPMIAAADGTVVSVERGEKSYRGKEIILRHTPEQTGIPGYWIYTQYAHFNVMPEYMVGDKVKIGENLGPTGNSGIGRSGMQSGKRRPAIHFAVWFTKSPNYALTHGKLIPVKGQWMDPNALYRAKPPFDSYSLRDLPKSQKKIPIPVMTEDGKFIPANTKLIWPYACKG
ncbi:MAG: M23 family metallopeptidase [Rhodospirillaceae bacterium]|nr:M23 family metallopeptidase [Rhodospirillaceae bacterium]MBL6940603.1 M23 family metallopeptidase [Rhodospirillales bacterium]